MILLDSLTSAGLDNVAPPRFKAGSACAVSGFLSLLKYIKMASLSIIKSYRCGPSITISINLILPGFIQ